MATVLDTEIEEAGETDPLTGDKKGGEADETKSDGSAKTKASTEDEKEEASLNLLKIKHYRRFYNDELENVKEVLPIPTPFN